MIFSPVEIQETVNMFMRHKLDIRCITMGISLLDCADSDVNKACDKIYNKIKGLFENNKDELKEIAEVLDVWR